MAFAALGDGRRAWELLAMINPLNHSRTAGEVAVYKAEPYVVPADVYALPPHAGRGGWTWYTGSAGWMYRLIVESILGLRREGSWLSVAPCLPQGWPGFSLVYRFGSTAYRIVVTVAAATDAAPGCSVRLDGGLQADGRIPLVDDQVAHMVAVQLLRAPVGVGALEILS
jgi:cellobiose phosphorylase